MYLRGGGTTWMPGTYDPQLNLIFWGTSNPAPDFDGGPRPGDDLYTDCVLAIDPDTGKLKWHFQFMPHDLYDYDATETPMLVDANYKGQPRKLLVQANRNGFLYVLDRTNGAFLNRDSIRRQSHLGQRHRRKWPPDSHRQNSHPPKAPKSVPALSAPPIGIRLPIIQTKIASTSLRSKIAEHFSSSPKNSPKAAPTTRPACAVAAP